MEVLREKTGKYMLNFLVVCLIVLEDIKKGKGKGKYSPIFDLWPDNYNDLPSLFTDEELEYL